MTTTVENLRGVVSFDVKPAQLQLLALKASLVGVASGAAQSLAGAGVALASALAPATGILATLPAGITALATSALGLKTAFSGVSDAMAAQKAATEALNLSGQDAVLLAQQRRAAAWGLSDAIRGLADAEKALAEAQKPAKVLDMREAELSLRSARLNQAEAVAAAAKSERDYAVARQQVYKAVTGIKDEFTGKTLEFVTEVKADNSDPLEVARQREAAAIRIEAAEIGVLRAQEAQVELAKQGTSKDEAVQSALRGVEQAQRNLLLAQEQYNQAQKAGGASGVATTEALAKAMDKLSPSAQEFVRTLEELKPVWRDLSKEVQEGFFQGLNKGLSDAMPGLGVLRDGLVGVGTTFGDFAADLGRMIGSSGFLTDLSDLFRSNKEIIDDVLDGVLNLTDAFRHVMIVAQPMTDWLSDGIEKWTEQVALWAESGRKTGELADFFEKTMSVITKVKDATMEFGGALKDVGIAAAPLGSWLLEATKRNAEEMHNWTGQADNLAKMTQYFNEMKPALSEIASLLSETGQAFIRIGDQKQVAEISKLLRTELLPVIEEILTKLAQSGIIESFIPVLAKAAELFYGISGATGVLRTSLEILEPIIGGIVKILEAPIIGDVATTLIVMGGAFGIVSKAAGIAAGAVGAFSTSMGMAAVAQNFHSTVTLMGVAFSTLASNMAGVAVGVTSASASLRLFAADMRAAIGAMGFFNAAMIGAAGILVALTIYNNKMDEAKRKSQELADTISTSIGKAAQEGDFDTVNAKLEETRKQIAGIDEDIKNSSAPWDKDYRDQLSTFKGQLQTDVIDPYQGVITQSEQLSRLTGISTDKAYEFINAQQLLGIEFDSGRDAMVAYNEEVRRSNEEELQKRLDMTLSQISAEERLRRSKLDGTAAIDAYNKTLSDANMDGVITPEEAADIESAYRSAYDAAMQTAEGVVAVAGANATAEEKADLFRNSLVRSASTMAPGSELRTNLVDTANDQELIVGDKKTVYTYEGLDTQILDLQELIILQDIATRNDKALNTGQGTLSGPARKGNPLGSPGLSPEENKAATDEYTNYLNAYQEWLANGQQGEKPVLPRRAYGGPVGAGRAYLVGERGPEIFTPGSSGYVTPNHKIGGDGGSIGDYGKKVTINNTFNETVDPKHLSRELAWNL